jgi:heterotetrameric sarcosine oxidase gamma subunit
MSEPGVVVRIRDGYRMASVIALRDRTPELTKRAMSLYGLTLRDGPFRDVGSEVDALGTGRRRWMLIRYRPDDAFVVDAARALEGLAAVCDQSDGYVVLEVAGRSARAALAKGVPIDLHPRSFTASDVAVTNVAHVNAVIWLVDSVAAPASGVREPPAPMQRFCLGVPRSYIESFLSFLSASAMEFGVDVS